MKKTFLLFTFLLGLGMLVTPVAQAASEDECAIWLCLPGGFPSGCGSAKSAMENRLKKGKSPLPDFGSCAIDSTTSGGSTMSYDYGRGAWLPERQQCVRWSRGHGDEWCTKYTTLPAEFVKGQSCTYDREYGSRPPGCKSKRYIDVYVDGVAAGETYYW